MIEFRIWMLYIHQQFSWHIPVREYILQLSNYICFEHWQNKNQERLGWKIWPRTWYFPQICAFHRIWSSLLSCGLLFLKWGLTEIFKRLLSPPRIIVLFAQDISFGPESDRCLLIWLKVLQTTLWCCWDLNNVTPLDKDIK